MEKVVALLRAEQPDDQWCEQIRGSVGDELLDLGVAGLAVNVRDSTVRDSLMTLTTLAPPVAAIISIWTQQSYGGQVAKALALLASHSEQLAAYLVTESVPIAPPDTCESMTPLADEVICALTPAPFHGVSRWYRDFSQITDAEVHALLARARLPTVALAHRI